MELDGTGVVADVEYVAVAGVGQEGGRRLIVDRGAVAIGTASLDLGGGDCRGSGQGSGQDGGEDGELHFDCGFLWLDAGRRCRLLFIGKVVCLEVSMLWMRMERKRYRRENEDVFILLSSS